MDKLLVVIVLGWVGLLFGSFAGAQVWRIRARQLEQDVHDGEKVDAAEYARLKPLLRPVTGDRSECLSCHHRLAWYDLLPLVSWLSTGGVCRYCRKPIGWFEPMMEMGTLILFVASYLLWPWPLTSMLEIVRFTLWLMACVVMLILFAYDAKWSLLPFSLNVGLIAIGIVYAAVSLIGHNQVHFSALVSLGGAIGILGGLYLLFSLRGWVGMGDGILGIGLALLLLEWKLAFLTLFLANLFGCFMLIPLALRKKLHSGARIPFGPFLILATVVAMFWGNTLIALVSQSAFSVY